MDPSRAEPDRACPGERVFDMSYRVALGVLSLLLAFMAACTSPETQAERDIAGPPSCEECEIELVPTVLLASEVGAGSPRYPATVVRLANGSYAAGPTYQPGTVARFSSDGQFEAAVGEYGEGPGELEEVHEPVRWVGDSLAVLHDANAVTVFDDGGNAVRTVSLAPPSFLTRDIARTPEGTILARRTGTAGGSDFPLREYTDTGDPLRQFGTETPLGAGRTYGGFATDGATVWALDARRYEIDVFPSGGAPDTIARQLEWFPPDGPRNEWGGRPSVEAVALRDTGELMVLVRRPREDYEFTPRGSSSGPAQAAARRSDHDDLMERYEQFIEVLDLDERQVIVSFRVEGQWIGGFVGGDEVFTYYTDLESDRAGVQLWSVTIVGAPE